MQRLSTKYGVAYTISHGPRNQWRWNSTATTFGGQGDIENSAVAGEAISQESRRPGSILKAQSSGRAPTSEERRQRILDAERRRKAERIEGQQKAEEQRLAAQEQTQLRLLRIRAAEEQRRNERLAAAKVAIELTGEAPTGQRRPAQKGPGRPTTRSQTRAKAAAAANEAKQSPTSTSTDMVLDEEGDFTMEQLEAFEPQDTPAEFGNPELATTNLETLFRPSSLPGYSLTAQAIKEKLGGNYFRYSPRDIPADRSALPPAQQVHLILAKRRDVPVNLRQDASAIVTSTTGPLKTNVART